MEGGVALALTVTSGLWNAGCWVGFEVLTGSPWYFRGGPSDG